jgi:hypothetical protein
MCDYSLHHVKSRPAKVGDKLRTVNFNTGTRGFASPDARRKSRAVFNSIGPRLKGSLRANVLQNTSASGRSTLASRHIALVPLSNTRPSDPEHANISGLGLNLIWGDRHGVTDRVDEVTVCLTGGPKADAPCFSDGLGECRRARIADRGRCGRSGSFQRWSRSVWRFREN